MSLLFSFLLHVQIVPKLTSSMMTLIDRIVDNKPTSYLLTKTETSKQQTQ